MPSQFGTTVLRPQQIVLHPQQTVYTLNASLATVPMGYLVEKVELLELIAPVPEMGITFRIKFANYTGRGEQSQIIHHKGPFTLYGLEEEG